MASGPPGHVNEGICRPTFIGRGAVAERRSERRPLASEEVDLRGISASRSALAAAEGGAADQGERTTGGLAQDELARRRPARPQRRGPWSA